MLVELGVLAITWYLAPLAGLLDQRPPTIWGFLLALVAIPAVIGVDRVDKWRRGNRVGGRIRAVGSSGYGADRPRVES